MARPILAVAVLAAAVGAATWSLVAGSGMMPAAAAAEAVLVDHAFDAMLALTVPIFALVVAAILYAVWRFRPAGEAMEEGARFESSRSGLAETLWISASLVLTLSLAAYGAREYRLLKGDERADLDVQVTASQWSWEFKYPAAGKFTTSLLLPKGRRVRLLLTSQDVVHSFWVPEFRVKQDIMAGTVTTLYVTPTKLGRYKLLCSELCGLDHTSMTADVEVVEPEQFDKEMAEEGVRLV